MSSLKENKMGTMPIGRLLLTMALPMALTHSTPFRWPSRCRTS